MGRCSCPTRGFSNTFRHLWPMGLRGYLLQGDAWDETFNGRDDQAGRWSQHCNCHPSEWYRSRRGVRCTIPTRSHLVWGCLSPGGADCTSCYSTQRGCIGTFPAKAPETHKRSAVELAAIIKAGGGTVEVHDDIQFQRYSKLLVNAAWNPTCALTRSRDAQFLKSSPGAIDFVRSVMLEVASIAQAVGYGEINADLIEFQLSRATARDLPGVEPSMLADALAGRAMEVEAIVGNTIRIARKYGVKTPLLDGLYALAKALDVSLARE